MYAHLDTRKGVDSFRQLDGGMNKKQFSKINIKNKNQSYVKPKALGSKITYPKSNVNRVKPIDIDGQELKVQSIELLRKKFSKISIEKLISFKNHVKFDWSNKQYKYYPGTQRLFELVSYEGSLNGIKNKLDEFKGGLLSVLIPANSKFHFLEKFILSSREMKKTFLLTTKMINSLKINKTDFGITIRDWRIETSL